MHRKDSPVRNASCAGAADGTRASHSRKSFLGEVECQCTRRVSCTLNRVRAQKTPEPKSTHDLKLEKPKAGCNYVQVFFLTSYKKIKVRIKKSAMTVISCCPVTKERNKRSKTEGMGNGGCMCF